jgi:heterotetrameric sarcosine oxidase gamma subunit
MKGDPSDWMVMNNFGEQINSDPGFNFVDLSAAFEAFIVEGPLTREFLSCGCSLDVWAPEFGVGTGVRTRFGPFDVALDMIDAERCEMLFARSVLIDAKKWLERRAASLLAAGQQGRL